MNIGIFDVDSKIPNLALMKISSYHKSLGHTVEFYNPIEDYKYEKVYVSKVFSEKHENDDYIKYNDPRFLIGGTGVNIHVQLEKDIEKFEPDYSLYGIDYNIGFSMRGCRLKCKFCIVPDKEGKAFSSASIQQLLTNIKSNNLLLLDNDYFGNPNWESVSNELIALNNKVCINQGINARVLTDHQAKLFSQINFRDIKFNNRVIYTAWDNTKDEKLFFGGIEKLFKYGILPSHLVVYVLIGYDSTQDEDMYRVNKLKNLGINPFVMPYNKNNIYQKKFARWVNNKALFKSITFDEYGKSNKTSHEKRELTQNNLFSVGA